MKIHELTTKRKKSAQRVGRGGKRGTTSGKGQKGQKSRSGHRIRPAIRDLISRIPKRRGYRNRVKNPKPFVVSIKQLIAKTKPLSAGNPVAVNIQVLKKVSLVPAGHHGKVKILGSSAVPLPIILEGIEASGAVAAAIEKGGGRIRK